MAKVNRSQPSPPRRTSIGGFIAAIVVVAVFIVLGFTLANTSPGAQTGAVPAATLPTNAPVAVAPQPETAGQAVDPAIAARNNKYKAAPPMTIDAKKKYTATITTPRGDIEVQLRPDLAPETVNSFVFLAKEGFYDGLTWHRVLQGFMAQGGDPTGTGSGGPGYTVKGEFTKDVLFDRPGIVAMARPGNDVNGNGSQFFITTAPAPSLNDQYTIFGEVTKGQEIVDAIPLRDPEQSPTTPGEQIAKITVSEQ